MRIGGTDFDRLLSLERVMPQLGHRSPAKRDGLDVPSSYFHDLATWSSINRLYGGKVRREVEAVRREARQPELIERLLAVLSAERGHTLAMAVEDAKIALSDREGVTIPLDWIEAALSVGVARSDLVRATGLLAERLRARAAACVRAAGLGPGDVDAIVLTGGSTRVAHARAAIVAAAPAARAVDGDTFGAVGLGLTLEAGRRYGPARARRVVGRPGAAP